MKTTAFSFLLCLFWISLFAQAPQAFKYQAVARNSSGDVLENKSVSFRISLLRGSTSGTMVYSETHQKITNSFGLVDLEIGKGTILNGDFTAINWGQNTYFIKVEMDPIGGNTYQYIGTSQLLSVPYALHAKTAETAKDAATKADIDDLLKKIELLNNISGIGSVTDVDGNEYKTITIGDQVWMAENLKTTKYNDSTAIPLITDNTAWKNLTTPGYCWYNNEIGKGDIYGALYNWYAVNTWKLCPAGWHVTSDAEWIVLTNYLIDNGYGFEGSGDDIAKSMAATTNWASSSTSGTPGNNPGSNNSSGFLALPGGYRNILGYFQDIGYYGNWWSFTEWSTDRSLGWLLYCYNIRLGRSDFEKEYGFSIRCLKDF